MVGGVSSRRCGGDTWQTFGHLLAQLVAGGAVWKNEADVWKSLRHIILLAFCQPSCHTRFGERSLLGSPATSWQQKKGGGLKVARGWDGGPWNDGWVAEVLSRTTVQWFSFILRVHSHPYPACTLRLTWLTFGAPTRRDDDASALDSGFLSYTPLGSCLGHPLSGCRAKSLIVAQFSSYCICRSRPHISLLGPTSKLPRHPMFSFTCPTACTVEQTLSHENEYFSTLEALKFSIPFCAIKIPMFFHPILWIFCRIFIGQAHKIFRSYSNIYL